MAELKTRLVLRNDTTGNWTRVNPVLKLGEIGIDTTLNQIKIGDGSTAWNDLPFSSNNEIDATMVEFTSDITATYEFGKYKPSGSGSVTIPAEGKTIQEFFVEALAEEKNPKTTQPSVSVTCPQAKAYEVGTKVTPSFTATLNAGSYEFGPATGVTATSWSVTDSASSPAVEAATGSFPELTVGDSTNYTITATAQHTAGVVPVTNIGNNYEAGKIAAGSKSRTSGAITGFRAWFVGSNITGAAVEDSDAIRALTNRGKAGPMSDVQYSFADGTKVVVIAVPAKFRVTKVLDVGAFGTDIFALGSFKSSIISVEGVDGYEGTNYNVYTYKPDAALGANTYKITIANA